MKQAKVKIQNDLTGILRSPSLNHVETTSKQFLSCFYCTLSLTLESQKDPSALF